jgi:ADP-heptose:LPS heptosyltransferase
MRILLVRLREIGDVVFTTPAVRVVRQRYPDAHISYLVEPHAAPVVAHNPHIDQVLVAERRRGLARLVADAALARRLYAGRYDLAIDFHGGPRASLLTWLSGARARIGYEVPGRGWMYTVRVPRPREIRARHAVENQWDLLAPLDVPPPDPRGFPVEMPVDSGAAARVAERMADAGVTREDRVIVVHVSAGNPFRRWPSAAFSTLVTMLALRDARRRIVVTSGPSDRHTARQVIEQACELLEPPERRRIVSGEDLSLEELRALLETAVLFVGGDSGPLHVAATSRAPIVAIFGPTLPVRSRPWRPPEWPVEAVEGPELPCRPCDQRRCEPGDFRCLGWLRPETVIAAAERVLSPGRMREGPTQTRPS